MLAFLKANYLTILIILVLVAIVVGIICSIVKEIGGMLYDKNRCCH